jgi:hypothetical protein
MWRKPDQMVERAVCGYDATVCAMSVMGGTEHCANQVVIAAASLAVGWSCTRWIAPYPSSGESGCKVAYALITFSSKLSRRTSSFPRFSA